MFHSLQNVVVVTQPGAPPVVTEVTVTPRATTYITLTVVLMVLCLIQCNFAALLCLIPALTFAVMVSHIHSGKATQSSGLLVYSQFNYPVCVYARG